MSAGGTVELAGAAFGYGGRPVVCGVDLRIAPGTFLAVLGPNGAGKTTLLRGLLGLLPPLGGEVRLTGVRFGYVPQRESLDPVFPLTVLEVVEMGAAGRLTPGRRAAAGERVLARESLEQVGLDGRRRSRFASLSGGQRQRVLLARALVARPNVLVLDEPTSGVDAPTQELVLALLARLNREADLAIVLVSHQLELMRTVRELAWVAGGRVEVGPAAELGVRLSSAFAGTAGQEAAWRG